jgi:nicotinate-nucleotide pyrophosphorylase (carboxylating)
MYDHFVIDRLIDLWLTEDIGACDLTAQTMIEPDELGSFCMNAREAMIVSIAPKRASYPHRTGDW